MDKLIDLINANEAWLVERAIEYAKIRGYAKYTSPLREAWRLSIAGLSRSLSEYAVRFQDIPDFGPDDCFEDDRLTAFGTIEAKRHRPRGVDLSMFLGLTKYYKQCYIDLVCLKGVEKERIEKYRLFIERCFDRIEIAFCQEWAGHSRDVKISELQAINRLMTNEKNVYLTLFESQVDPTIILNQDDEIVHLNHAATRIVDPGSAPGSAYYQYAEFIGNQTGKRRLDEPLKIIGARVDDIFPWVKKIIKERQINPTSRITREARFSKGDTHTYYEVSCSEILDVSDQLRGSILTLRDITDRKNAEAALKQVNETLERHVEARTADLKASNDMLAKEVEERKRIEGFLIEAKEKAEMANCAKNEFLANVSHEIRTPLNGILVLIDLLQDMPLEQQQVKYLQMAQQSSQELMVLLNDLLTFSKIEAGQLSATPVEFNLKSIIKSAISDQLPIIMAKGLEVTFRVQAELPTLFRGDPGHLRQILINLLNNAVKYTSRGQIVISVTPSNILASRRNTPSLKNTVETVELEFSVSDPGIGIPSQKQEDIFEMFTQVDGSHCRAVGGVGLGLSICRGLVNLMGGEIWCRSKLGMGSTFYFTLPLRPVLQPFKKHEHINHDSTIWNESVQYADRNGNGTGKQFMTDAVGHQKETSCSTDEESLNHSTSNSILKNFILKGPNAIKQLKTALHNVETPTIEKQAAILRKYASQIGAETLKKSLFRIELACRREDFGKLPGLVWRAIDAYDDVMARLEKNKASGTFHTEQIICEF